MAVAARQENREYYAPVTRVYSRGATAVAAEPAFRPEPQAVPQPQERQKQRPQVQARPAVSPLQRVLAVLVICAVAAALLFVLVRYARIADEYAVVNEIKGQIEKKNITLEALNVELQLAASLDDAKETAQRMGMSYPTVDQIHRLGDPLVSASVDDSGIDNSTAGDDLPLQNQG